jgi:hypothetical protein
MFGKKTQLTPLAARKKLLLLESDLNREQFLRAVQDCKAAIEHSGQSWFHFESLTSLLTKSVPAFPAINRLFATGPAGGKKSKLAFLFDAVSTGTSLWFLIRSLRRKSRPADDP